MKRIGLGIGLTAAVVTAGCVEEIPTAVGGSLTAGALRTFEVVLDPAVFLAGDTTYGGLRSPATVGFRLVARSFESQLNARTLLRYTAPTSVTYQDTTDNSTTDTIPQFVGARLFMEVDTSTVTAPPGSSLEVYTVVESWDRESASWTFRVDTAGAQLPWTEPGGTTGALLGSATWDPDLEEDVTLDTIVVAIDSAGAAAMTDTLNQVDGVLVRGGTPDTRFRIRSSRLLFQVRPQAKPDTVIEVTATQASTFIIDPDPPAPGDSVVRVGGVPGWRAVFRFLPLADIELDLGADCGTADCTVPIGEVTLNYAGLLLEPSFPGGFRPERNTVIEVRDVLETPGVPLSRSPLSARRGGTDTTGVALARFTATAAPGPVDIPVTEFVQRLVDPERADEDRATVMALLPAFEGAIFGYTEFYSLETPNPPRLRLVVSVVNPERIQ